MSSPAQLNKFSAEDEPVVKSAIAPALRIVSSREVPADPQLQRRWNELVLRMEQPEVFYTYEWALAMQHAYARSRQPWVFLGYEQNALVGVVALATAGDTVQFLASTTADYCNFVSAPDRRREFVDAVFAELKKAEIGNLVLASVPQMSVSVAAIFSAASKYGYHISTQLAASCARVNLDLGEARPKLKRDVEHKLRRKLKGVKNEGPELVRHFRSWHDVQRLIPGFFGAHVARFFTTGRTSNIASHERQEFLLELARLLSNAGWFTLSILEFSGTPAAWNYGFEFAGSWFWYQPTFDPRFAARSPGLCLLAALITDACDSPQVRVVDLGLGDEQYKSRFANGSNATVDIEATLSLARYCGRTTRRVIVRAIKNSRNIESVIRASLGRIRRLHERVNTSGCFGTLKWLTLRIMRVATSRSEVRFYQWRGEANSETVPSASLRIVPLEFETVGIAGLTFGSDQSTMDYLRRVGPRLSADGQCGYALLDEHEKIVHFAWTRNCDGFYLDELGFALPPSDPNSTMIFDCFTPESFRGRGYYGAAVSLIADKLRREGRVPWIFASAENPPSLRGLAHTEFEHCYTLVRRHFLFWNRIRKTPPQSHANRSASA